MHPLVVHVSDKHDVYIGRPGPWGNPFTIEYSCGSRQMAINLFIEYYTHSQNPKARWMREHIHELKGKRLGCYCAPQDCHGDFLAQQAELSTPPERTEPCKD